ncbi:unnamed protein product [Staurois parvus]|uniref:Uncharacterized protein n=1 Tax=Staurois parvus TaxID=386267 RepID=A0ABN9F9N9_9NEOB|nr:unnamed protein product [Staurois parvus]
MSAHVSAWLEDFANLAFINILKRQRFSEGHKADPGAGADWPFGNSFTARGPKVSRGPHEMPLVPFS